MPVQEPRRNESSLPIVTIYTKATCPLCAEAMDELRDLQKRIPFQIEVIDIFTDLVLFEKHRSAIPVICINGTEICHYRVDEARLAAALIRLS